VTRGALLRPGCRFSFARCPRPLALELGPALGGLDALEDGPGPLGRPRPRPPQRPGWGLWERRSPGSDPVGAVGLLPADCSPKLLEGGGSCGDLPDGRRDDPHRFAAPRREPRHPRRDGSQPGCLALATSSHRSTGRAEQRQNSRLDAPLLWSDHATSSGWHPRQWRSDDDNNESRQGWDAVQSGGGDSGSL
jgi:hypothetical protein